MQRHSHSVVLTHDLLCLPRSTTFTAKNTLRIYLNSSSVELRFRNSTECEAFLRASHLLTIYDVLPLTLENTHLQESLSIEMYALSSN